MGTKVTRMYTGLDGQSHFEDVEIATKHRGAVGRWSEDIRANRVSFAELDRDYDHSWHNAPSRQLVITLEGEGEIEVADGIKRRFKAGDILLAEDTTGKGHCSRFVGNQARKILIVSLGEETLPGK